MQKERNTQHSQQTFCFQNKAEPTLVFANTEFLSFVKKLWQIFSFSEWANKIESDKLARYYCCWLRLRLEVEQWFKNFYPSDFQRRFFCYRWTFLHIYCLWKCSVFCCSGDLLCNVGQEMPQLMRVVAKIASSSHPQKMWILAQYAKIGELK